MPYYYYARQPKIKYGEVQREKDGRIRYRDIYPSKGRLKEIQKRINRILQKVKLPEYAYGSVKQKSNILNALKHQGNTHALSVDLKNFFPNISHHRVFEMYVQNGFSPTVAHILTKLTTYWGSLPQGAPPSSTIANLVFVKTGNRLSSIAESANLCFTTFLDDLNFSSKEDFKSLVPKILHEIRLDGFFLQHKKITYRDKKIEITGIQFDSNRLTVNSVIRNRAHKNVHIRQYLNRVEKAAESY